MASLSIVAVLLSFRAMTNSVEAFSPVLPPRTASFAAANRIGASYPFVRPTRATLLCSNGNDVYDNDTASDDKNSEEAQQDASLQAELERLQNELSYIDALEERNAAQLDSFVDAQDQWDSLEEEERQLLLSKEAVVERMESIAETLVQLWMGQKSMDG